MGDFSRIGWTGATWNPYQGCHKVSEGCKFCYMFRDMIRYGQDPNVVRLSKSPTFRKPLKWQAEFEQGLRTGQGRLVFTCSWSDWFIEEADPWRADAWEIVRRCPDLVFQVLTKRADRIADHLPWGPDEEPWPNVWLGVSVENQRRADERIPHLLGANAAVRFLSVEPMLGPVDLREIPLDHDKGSWTNPLIGTTNDGDSTYFYDQPRIDWVIVGGESGNATGDFIARPTHIDHIRGVVEQCRAACVACFVKQIGSDPRFGEADMWAGNADRRIRAPHGDDPSEWPPHIQVQQFPLAAYARGVLS